MNKKVLSLILAGLVLFAIIFGIDRFNQARYESRIVKVVDRRLTDQERKIYEDRLAETEPKIQSAQSDQEKVELLRYKAIQLQGLGKLWEAKDVLVEALNINSQDFNVNVSLHLVYLEMQDFESARTSIKKAISVRRNSADAWRRYIFLEKTHFGASEGNLKSWFNEALTNTNNHIDMVTVYAAYLEEIGDLQGAKEQWQKAIEINKENKALYEAEIKRIDEKLKN